MVLVYLQKIGKGKSALRTIVEEQHNKIAGLLSTTATNTAGWKSVKEDLRKLKVKNPT